MSSNTFYHNIIAFKMSVFYKMIATIFTLILPVSNINGMYHFINEHCVCMLTV